MVKPRFSLSTWITTNQSIYNDDSPMHCTGRVTLGENLWNRHIQAEKTQTKGELEKPSLQFATTQTEITPEAMNIILAVGRAQFDRLQESGNVREIKAWLMQFVARIELGYNRARIFYAYSMIDLFSTGGNLRNTFPHLGGTLQDLSRTTPIMCWAIPWNAAVWAADKIRGVARHRQMSSGWLL